MRQFVREIIKISSGAANGWTFIKGNAKSWRDARNRFPRGEKNLSKVEQGFGRVRVNPYTSAESISAEANFSIFRKGRGGETEREEGGWSKHTCARARVYVAQFPRWRAGQLPVDGPIYHGPIIERKQFINRPRALRSIPASPAAPDSFIQ